MNAQTEDGWYDPNATTFGDRVAGAREQAGMSQADLAKRLGVKLKTLKSWEDDLSEPRANKLSMMAGMLNVSLLWLLPTAVRYHGLTWIDLMPEECEV